MTARPRALAASALVTTEQESKLPAAAVAEPGGEADDAVALVAGELDDGADAEEDEDAQAASKTAAQMAMAEIATGRRRI